MKKECFFYAYKSVRFHKTFISGKCVHVHGVVSLGQLLVMSPVSTKRKMRTSIIIEINADNKPN